MIGSIKYGEEIAIDHDVGNGWLEIFWGQRARLRHEEPDHPPLSRPVRARPQQARRGDGRAPDTTACSLHHPGSPLFGDPGGHPGQQGPGLLSWAPSKSATLLKSFPEGTQVTVIAELKNGIRLLIPSAALSASSTPPT